MTVFICISPFIQKFQIHKHFSFDFCFYFQTCRENVPVISDGTNSWMGLAPFLWVQSLNHLNPGYKYKLDTFYLSKGHRLVVSSP